MIGRVSAHRGSSDRFRGRKKTPQNTPTPTPTNTPTSEITLTPTPTNTVTPSSSETLTPTPTPSITPTYTPSITPSASLSPTPTPTYTPTTSDPLDGSYYYITTDSYVVCHGFAPSDIIYGQNGLNIGRILYQDTAGTNPYTISELQTFLNTTGTTFYVKSISGGEVFTVTSDINGNAVAQSSEPCVSPTNTPTQTPTQTQTVTPTTTPTQTQTVTPTTTQTVTPTTTPTNTVTPTLTPTITPTTSIAVVSSDPTLEIWYDFSDVATITLGTGSDITAVADKSTGTVKPANSTGGKRPKQVLNYQNGKAVSYFDGANDLFTVNPITNFQSLTGNTMIVVGKFNNTATIGQTMTQLGNGGNERNANWLSIRSGNYQIGMGGGLSTTSGVTLDTNFHIFTCVFDGTQTGNSNRLKFRVDGNQKTLTYSQNVGATTATDTTVFYIGETASATEDLDGYIGEILLYTKTLTASEITNTESYLKNKWGIV